MYFRHFVEDANNPVGAFEEMARVSRRGYIETPSPMMEALYFQVSPSHTRKLRSLYIFFAHYTLCLIHNTLYIVHYALYNILNYT
jgi:hypothetical protein